MTRRTDLYPADSRLPRGASPRLGSGLQSDPRRLPYDAITPTREDIDLGTASPGGLTGRGQKFNHLAGTVFNYAAGGTTSAQDNDARIEVRFGGRGDFVPFFPGESWGGIPFDFLEIRWAEQSGKTATVIVTTDERDVPLRVQ